MSQNDLSILKIVYIHKKLAPQKHDKLSIIIQSETYKKNKT